MLCIDFEYDGQQLSDYGYMICNIGSGTNVETINIGSQLTLNTVNLTRLNKFKISSAQYDSAYTVTFQIAKTGCRNKGGIEIDEYELSRMMRWLNRKEYHKFKGIYENGECAKIYYMGTFNVQIIQLCKKTIGMELTLQTNAPLGYYEPTEYYMDLSSAGDCYKLCDNSDEAGFIYPEKVEIECLKQGNLTITNSKDVNPTIINNCTAGETITLHGESKQITSNKVHDKLYNDFNYNFIRIINRQENGIDDNDNVFSATLPCKIRLVYSPICKVGVI